MCRQQSFTILQKMITYVKRNKNVLLKEKMVPGIVKERVLIFIKGRECDMEKTEKEICALMEKVNDYWIAQNPETGDCAWERAAYFLGNMAAYEILKKPAYLEYAVRWAEKNGWNFSRNPQDQTTNADDLSCGETYMDLMEKYGVKGSMDHIRKTMEWTVQDPKNDYWWWIDAIYMALHFYNRMGICLKEKKLFDKAYRLFLNTKMERGLYDREEKLWYRDAGYLPDKVRTADGKKVFWSRGNGWVFAGLARTLEVLSPEHASYGEYEQTFREMAQSLRGCQCEEGFWHTSLLSPEEYDMPETSGTVLNVLGMLMGIRLGILPEDYRESAGKGFDALLREAVEKDGRIGWVQTVAAAPGAVKKECTNDYAVGTFLLVCRELIYEMRAER